MGAEAAARLGDEIAHGPGMAAMLAGAVAGALVGAAIVTAAAIAAPVTAAIIVGGSIAASALSMKQLMRGFCTVFKLPEPAAGTLMKGSSNVFINGKPAVRAGIDTATPCTGVPLNHPALLVPVLVAQGSATVFVNGRPVARLKDQLVCGAHISGGSNNVFIGGGSQGTGRTIYDLEHWTELSFEWLGLAALVGAGALAASVGVGALAIFGAATLGINAGLTGLGKLGDRLGPGYGDLLQGMAELGLLLAGPKFATRQITKEFEFNSVENPGPLASLPNNPAANFFSGKYNMSVLPEDTIFYRGGEAGKPLGQWLTREAPDSVAQVRIDSAVKPQWIDPKTGVLTGSSSIDTIYAIKIPKGTTIYEGPVGYQGGVNLGGPDTNQIFVQSPWKIPGVQVLSSAPIK